MPDIAIGFDTDEAVQFAQRIVDVWEGEQKITYGKKLFILIQVMAAITVSGVALLENGEMDKKTIRERTLALVDAYVGEVRGTMAQGTIGVH